MVFYVDCAQFLRDYAGLDILANVQPEDIEDEMSLLMMINRIQTPQDFNDFINSNQEEIRGIVDRASESIVQIIVNAFWALFMKMKVSVGEATDCLIKMIGGSQMGNWFENMEPMDIQEERAKTKAAEEKLGEAEKKLQEAQIESIEPRRSTGQRISG